MKRVQMKLKRLKWCKSLKQKKNLMKTEQKWKQNEMKDVKRWKWLKVDEKRKDTMKIMLKLEQNK